MLQGNCRHFYFVYEGLLQCSVCSSVRCSVCCRELSPLLLCLRRSLTWYCCHKNILSSPLTYHASSSHLPIPWTLEIIRWSKLTCSCIFIYRHNFSRYRQYGRTHVQIFEPGLDSMQCANRSTALKHFLWIGVNLFWGKFDFCLLFSFVLNSFWFVCLLLPHSEPFNYIRNAHKWCAVIRKSDNVWHESNSTLAIDTWNLSESCS